ncbi:hypothetical protein VSAK1_26495 [Vibrio mediterranei AK1]|uniref:hypothetical protein n=1 Tax=Vibrio mediterranei TaxID=689 RepID=UPI0001542815|nr:hypothetical protein [Vibrio mediterranei]EDL52177.1 hypothetical protein VSAK1_26495 [Vibrio mediterranei AK1]
MFRYIKNQLLTRLGGIPTSEHDKVQKELEHTQAIAAEPTASMLMLAFKVIRIRSLISEALMSENVFLHICDDSNLVSRVVKIGCGTSDVIEHIADDALRNKVCCEALINDLKVALLVLDEFETPLTTYSDRIVPSREEIHHLMKLISTYQK